MAEEHRAQPVGGRPVHLSTPALCELCDVAGERTPADFDTKTTAGPWAYVCGPHFVEVGVDYLWTRVTWAGKG